MQWNSQCQLGEVLANAVIALRRDLRIKRIQRFPKLQPTCAAQEQSRPKVLPTRLDSLHLWFALQLHPELPIEFGALSTAVLAMPDNLQSKISFHCNESTSSVRILETNCLILHFISNSKTIFRYQKTRRTRKWRWCLMFDVFDDQQAIKLSKSSKSFHPQIGPTASTQQTHRSRTENAASTEKGSREHGIFLISDSQKCKERTKNWNHAWWLSFTVLIYNLHVFWNSDLQIYTKSLPGLYRFQGSKICSNNSTVHGKGKRTPINRRESDHLNSRWTASAVPCSWQGLSWIDVVVWRREQGTCNLKIEKNAPPLPTNRPVSHAWGDTCQNLIHVQKNKLRLVEA